MPPSRSQRGGSATADRIAARAEKGQLRRVAMADGGEVFTGKTAKQSLDAIGARAMTVDQSIVVSEDFDPNKPEDQALYAHEKVHLEGSGGEGSHTERDAEEIAARAAERMVLHRARAGESNVLASRSAAPEAQTPPSGGGVNAGGTVKNNSAPAQRGYSALRDEGFKHADVVDKLAREVISALDSRRELRDARHADRKGFL